MQNDVRLSVHKVQSTAAVVATPTDPTEHTYTHRSREFLKKKREKMSKSHAFNIRGNDRQLSLRFGRRHNFSGKAKKEKGGAILCLGLLSVGPGQA